jgi:quinol monooxygenase YgiN
MFGLIGKMRTLPGQRDALISILIEGVAGMPGCLSYVVAETHAKKLEGRLTSVWSQRVCKCTI